MAKTDASNWIVAEQLAYQTAAAANGNGAAVEITELPERAMGVLHVVGVGTDADETLDVTIEGRDSADDAWETVATFAQATQGDGTQVLKADLTANRREYRAVWTIAGTTPDFDFLVALVGDDLAHAGGAAAV